MEPRRTLKVVTHRKTVGPVDLISIQIRGLWYALGSIQADVLNVSHNWSLIPRSFRPDMIRYLEETYGCRVTVAPWIHRLP